ncbi:MAG: hypothetical protein ACO4CH_09105 [Saprospiraceae bacterium]
MPITIDYRENIMYKDGLERGIEQGREERRQTILKMWRTGRFSIDELAEILEMEVIDLKRQLKLAAESENRLKDQQSNPDL